MYFLEVTVKAIFITRVIKWGSDPGGRVAMPGARAATCAHSNNIVKEERVMRIFKHLLFVLHDKLGERAEPRHVDASPNCDGAKETPS